ncbi:cyclin-related protein FAM58A-like isoform 1 [Achlya hypogyna]|uniref:Cyclin-related protein FAM58A-like isoform 1 n=1 Tax=Achlya hypogyna TaxID=1202772 RepID=A0A1V9YAW3_ACHHY|nr:cyclin-related protein FAM58A-like isoform 1 [Achlya hypogyna]
MAADPSRRWHAISSFVADCCARLHLGYIPTTTAMLLSHRFYAQKSPQTFPFMDIGASCIFLATKLTEKPRKLRDIMNVAYSIAHKTNSPVPVGSVYTAMKERLLDAEQNILRVLRFELDMDLPYMYLLNYAKFLRCSRATVQVALTLTSDFFYAPRSLSYDAPIIAAACLYVALSLVGEHGGHSLPPQWWYEFDTSDDDLAAIQAEFATLYTVLPPPTTELVEATS